jgi:hypothetical protein
VPEYDPYHFREANLAPTDVKRQHYVPRHYLEAFADAGQVSVFDLDTDTGYVTNTINAGVETFFYDLRYEQESLSTESWFANEIEKPFWPLLARLRACPDDLLRLSDTEEVTVGRYLAAQRLRVPKRRVPRADTP